MSDRVKTAETEDVLSSIRRLVSSEARPGEGPADKSPGKLVLTPAHRVVQAEPSGRSPDDSATPAGPMILTRPIRESGADAGQDAVGNDMQKNEGRKVPDKPLYEEADTGSSDVMFVRSRTRTPPKDRSEASEPASATSEAHLGFEADGTARFGRDRHGDMALEQKVAELANLIAANDNSLASGFNSSTRKRRNDARTDERGPFVDERDGDDLVPVAKVFEPDRDAGVDVSRSEEVVGYVPDARHFTAQATPLVLPSGSDDGLSADGGVEEPDAARPVKASDADRLRKLVNDIVRQELQGPLGERITTDLRRMVQREVHRVLVERIPK